MADAGAPLAAIEWRHYEYGTVPEEVPEAPPALPAPPLVPQSYLPSSSSASQASVVAAIFSLFSTSSVNRCEFADIEFRWPDGSGVESVWAHSFVLHRSERWAESLASSPLCGLSSYDGATQLEHVRVVRVPAEVRRRTLLRELCMWYGGSIVQQHCIHSANARLQRERDRQYRAASAAPLPHHTDFAFFAMADSERNHDDHHGDDDDELIEIARHGFTLDGLRSGASSPLLDELDLLQHTSGRSCRTPELRLALKDTDDRTVHDNEIERSFIDRTFGRETHTLYDYVLSLLEQPSKGADAYIRIATAETTQLERSLRDAGIEVDTSTESTTTSTSNAPPAAAAAAVSGVQSTSSSSLLTSSSGSSSEIDIPVHRAIVCARCPWFAKTFSDASGFRHTSVVELAASESAVRSILRYLYIGDLFDAQRSEDVVEIAFLCDMLGIHALQTACTEALQQSLVDGRISLRDLPSFIHIADLMNLSGLRQLCIKESLKHFHEISFDGLPPALVKEIHALREALRKSPYAVPKEQTFGCARELVGVLNETLQDQVRHIRARTL